MRNFVIDVDPATADPDGICDNNASDDVTTTLVLDGVLTSGGTFTSADGLGHQISITDTATQDQSDSTFTITGTNANGTVLVEAVTGPGSGATVESAGYFLTISAIAVAGGDSGDTVDVGTDAGGEIETKTYPMNHRSSFAAGAQTSITGTINYTLQTSFSSILNTADSTTYDWTDITAYAAKTADVVDTIPVGTTGIRLITASYSAGAEIQVNVSPV